MDRQRTSWAASSRRRMRTPDFKNASAATTPSALPCACVPRSVSSRSPPMGSSPAAWDPPERVGGADARSLSDSRHLRSAPSIPGFQQSKLRSNLTGNVLSIDQIEATLYQLAFHHTSHITGNVKCTVSGTVQNHHAEMMTRPAGGDYRRRLLPMEPLTAFERATSARSRQLSHRGSSIKCTSVNTFALKAGKDSVQST